MKNKNEINAELKQQIEEKLRKAYRCVGYRNEGEIELNIRGAFLDKWAMKRQRVVVDGKEYENVMLLAIATDFGTSQRIEKEYNATCCETGWLRFDHSHRQTLYLMIQENGEMQYVLRDYDFFYDFFYLEDTHTENDKRNAIDIGAMSFEKFKPKDYYVNVPPLSNDIIVQLRTKLADVVLHLNSESTDVVNEYIDNYIKEVAYRHLTSVEIDNKGYKHVYVWPIAYYYGDLDYGRVVRYGKTCAYDQFKDLSFLIDENEVTLVESTHTSFVELNDNMVIEYTSEWCDCCATTISSLNDIEVKKYWLEIDQFKAEKERKLQKEAERAAREARRAEFRAKYSNKK